MITLASSILLALAIPAFAASDQGGLPHCMATVHDSVNFPIAEKEWRQELFMGEIQTPGRTVLISTSLGYDKVMSLWVREKREGNTNGMMTFVDLSSGKVQLNRLYLLDGYSVAVNCKWDADRR